MNTPEKELIFDPNGELLRRIETTPSAKFYKETTSILGSYALARNVIANSVILFVEQFLNRQIITDHAAAFSDGSSAAIAAAVAGKETLTHASFDEELMTYFGTRATLFGNKRQSSAVEAIARSSVAESRLLAPETADLSNAVLDYYHNPSAKISQDSLAQTAQYGFSLTVLELSRVATMLISPRIHNFDDEVTKILPPPEQH